MKPIPKKRKIIFSTGSIFNGGGIGDTSYNTILQSYREGYLDKIICWKHKESEIKDKDITNFKIIYATGRNFIRSIQKWFFKNFDSYYYINNLYDYLAAEKLTKSEIFHGGTNYSKRSLKKAKKMGATCIISHWSSHPLTQIKLIEDEYKSLGKKFFFNSAKSRKQMIEEINSADYISIPSDFVERSFIENGVPKEKLINIPFGVDLKKYDGIKMKKDKKFRAIFVGQVSIRKGIHYLLKAWNELNLKDSELLIVGSILPDAKEIVNQYKGNKNIKFTGFDDPKKYYPISDVFVFPSIEEGSALVTYEAMASGLPIIVTPNTGSIARNGKEGFIIPIRDVDKLKEKIEFMHDNQEVCEKMGKNARKYVEKFPWEEYSKKILEVYLKILKDRNGK